MRVDGGLNAQLILTALATVDLTYDLSPNWAVQSGMNIGFSMSQLAHMSLMYRPVDKLEIGLGALMFLPSGFYTADEEVSASGYPVEALFRMEYRP